MLEIKRKRKLTAKQEKQRTAEEKAMDDKLEAQMKAEAEELAELDKLVKQEAGKGPIREPVKGQYPNAFKHNPDLEIKMMSHFKILVGLNTKIQDAGRVAQIAPAKGA